MSAVDTNILVYRLDRHDPVKRLKARALIRRLLAAPTPPILLWQVLGEYVQQLRYRVDRGVIKTDGLLRMVRAVQRRFQIVMPRPTVLDRALDLSARFSLSHWDSMLLGACFEANVTTLYTEDMGAPTVIDGLHLVNPFI